MRLYLTECIHQLFLENQLTHIVVNFLFIIADENIKLTVLWGSCLSKTNLRIVVCDKV